MQRICCSPKFWPHHYTHTSLWYLFYIEEKQARPTWAVWHCPTDSARTCFSFMKYHIPTHLLIYQDNKINQYLYISISLYLYIYIYLSLSLPPSLSLHFFFQNTLLIKIDPLKETKGGRLRESWGNRDKVVFPWVTDAHSKCRVVSFDSITFMAISEVFIRVSFILQLY